jgi:hypothetical protein
MRSRWQIATIPRSVRSTLATVTGTLSTFVSNGSARLSSISVNRPVSCSSLL